MVRRQNTTLVILALVGILAGPLTVFAADAGTCRCWCGIDGVGAQRVDPDTEYASTAACEDRCSQLRETYVVCATATDTTKTKSEYYAAEPVSNPLCWTQSECETNKFHAPYPEGSTGEWDTNQPYECVPTERYCYAPTISVPLNVHLGSQTITLPIGSYINLVYTYGLGVAGVLVIVMIMIGGVQYILGSASGSEMVSKGKERIKNAVIGLVLLLSAYLVLATVNPALVQFKTLRLPVPKPADFLTASCEKMRDVAGYTLASNSGSCGDQGQVTTDPQGGALYNTTCVYDTCPETYDDCVQSNASGSNNGWICQINTDRLSNQNHASTSGSSLDTGAHD